MLSHRADQEDLEGHRLKKGYHKVNQSIDFTSQSPLDIPQRKDESNTIIYDDGFDKHFSQRRRLYGNAVIDRDFMIVAPKLKYNQHSGPEYQATLKYNIITGAEQEDKLPPLPSVRRGQIDTSVDNLVFKQREVDLLLKRMR